MRRAFLTIALLALSAAPAAADVRLIDPTTGAATTLVADDGAQLLTRLGDAFVVQRDGHAQLVQLDGRGTRAPQFDGGTSIGPGGQTVRTTASGYELHAPGGAALAAFDAYRLDLLSPGVAWSADGTRVAVEALEPTGVDQLRVLDTATGGVGFERGAQLKFIRLGEQAFSPDSSSLVFAENLRAFRADLGSGAVADLGHDAFAASWSPTGPIALTRRSGIAVPGSSGVSASVSPAHDARWSPDGRTLAFSLAQPRGECSSPYLGVAVAAPGAAARVLIKPSGRELRRFAWAPDGRLAVDLGAPDTSGERGRHHPWPRRVARDYKTSIAPADAAIRRVVQRAAQRLRRGAERETVMRHVRLEMAPIQSRYDEVTDDSAVRDAVAKELGRWLRAAGFGPIENTDDVMC
jgi:hypothetical protein